jgi:YVTN family beta-propeller protein
MTQPLGLALKNPAYLFAGLSVFLFGPASAGPGGHRPPHVCKGLAPTMQVLKPAGNHVAYGGGRPVDLVIAPGGKYVYVKDNRGLVVIDRASWKIVQQLRTKGGGGSEHGIVLSRDGKRLYLTNTGNKLYGGTVGGDGKVKWKRTIKLPGPRGKGNSHSTGLALSPNGKTLYVCMFNNNALGVVDLKKGKLVRQIRVGVAPWAVVVSPGGSYAFVSNLGGRHAGKKGPGIASTAGTAVRADKRGVIKSGTVMRIKLGGKGKVMQNVRTGLHPSGMALHDKSKRLFVANANSDTVTVLDSRTLKRLENITVHLMPRRRAFGSAANDVAVTPNGKKLYVACAGINAVAVVALGVGKNGRSRMEGFIPTAWYPGAVKLNGRELFVADVKGLGSRRGDGRSAFNYLGVVSKVPLPSPGELASLTQQVRQNERVPEMLRAWEQGQKGVKPVPVPRRHGEPSVFEHVVYVIKENRTYDQFLGDMKEGNGDPRLCLFGQRNTPNHHALAREFVLLDNYYCNGVVSKDGHAWATEGFVTGYLEKAFGGTNRSQYWGDDALLFCSSGFIWDHVLAKGRSFRNYGEFGYASVSPAKAKYGAMLRDKRGKIKYKNKRSVARLDRYSCPGYPGWNLDIPDQRRADIFLRELHQYERKGGWPNFIIVFLPQDHTSGTSPGRPTPQSYIADNDLALGRIVDGISHSKFWRKTCIFINEDDPQFGYDHVDGHRSFCFVISPYTRRRAVVHEFYNQNSVLHTMLRVLGCPPMNNPLARAPLMTACFTYRPNFAPYNHKKNQVPLGKLNPKKRKVSGRARYWAEKSETMDWSNPDAADEDTLNRIVWFAVHGSDADYPAELAGPHGNGLAARRLQHKMRTRK